MAGYILFQNKTESASERNTASSTFKAISEHARKTGEIRSKKVGLAAWESFLYRLEHDDFSKCAMRVETTHYDDTKTPSVEHGFIIYCDALCQIYTRKEPLPYYRSIAEQFPERREELEIAINALDACASYGGFLWSQGFTFDEAGYEKLKLPKPVKFLQMLAGKLCRRTWKP